MIDSLQILCIFFCLFWSAFFSGIETGVAAINRIRLKHFVRQEVKAAIILQGFLDDTDRLLGTTLVGNNICNVVISVCGASLAVKWFGGWGEAASVPLVSIMVLIFGEYLPKAWFSSRPYFRSTHFAPLLLAVERVLKPLARIMVGITRLLMRGKEKSFSKPLPFVSREDLKMLAKDGEASGVLTRHETRMINRVFELSGKKAREIMIPREKMVTVDSGMPVPAFLQLARSQHFKRFPVMDSDSGEFVGIVNVLYVLASLSESEGKHVGDFVRAAQFVPENMPVDEILPMMRRYRQPMWLVKAADGMVAGLVTTENILEEIVGKL